MNMPINTHALPLVEKSLADYIESHARQFYGHAAMEYLGVSFNYSELDVLANRMANVLHGLGVHKGDVIGIHLPNTPQYLITLIAASKLGAVVSGVSPLLTAPEIVHQVNDARIKVLLTLDQLFNKSVAPINGKVPGLRAIVVTGAVDFLPRWKQQLACLFKKVQRVDLQAINLPVHRLLPLWRDSSAAPVRTKVGPHDTIYIQYTGGTTGKPKGAELTQHSVFSSLQQMDGIVSYEAGCENLASAFPYFHMAGLAIAVLGLKHAARMLVIPDPRNIEWFCAQMRKFPPTILTNVPTLYQMLLEHPSFEKINFSRLKIAVSGAAPFPPELIHRLEAVIGKGKLCEGYGMTECSGVTVLNPPGHARIGSIGLPLPATKVRIVDVETGLQEMPRGEAGELIVCGPQVMKGYLNNPEATCKSIRKLDGDDWMYTGDIAVMDAEGYLTICDRAKDMLIVGGYKVFSVEIEGKLAELDCIELSAIIGIPDEKRPGNDIVHLYVQLSPAHKSRSQEELSAEIIGFCREQMSAYKIPKSVYFMDALPLTAVGKLDKKALRPA